MNHPQDRQRERAEVILREMCAVLSLPYTEDYMDPLRPFAIRLVQWEQRAREAEAERDEWKEWAVERTKQRDEAQAERDAMNKIINQRQEELLRDPTEIIAERDQLRGELARVEAENTRLALRYANITAAARRAGLRELEEEAGEEPLLAKLAQVEAERDDVVNERDTEMQRNNLLRDELSRLRSAPQPLEEGLRERVVAMLDRVQWNATNGPAGAEYDACVWDGCRPPNHKFNCKLGQLLSDLRTPASAQDRIVTSFDYGADDKTARVTMSRDDDGRLAIEDIEFSQPTPPALSDQERIERLEVALNDLAVIVAEMKAHRDLGQHHFAGPLGEIARELAQRDAAREGK